MRDVLTVFRFTLRDALRKKAFILTTVIVLVLIVAGCTVLRVVDMNKSAPDTGTAEPAPAEKSDTCYLMDDASLIPGALEALTAAQPTVDFVAGQSNKLNDYKAEVETDKSKSILVIAAGKTGQPELTFYSTDFMSGLPAETLTRVVQNVYVAGLLSQAGVSADVQQAALTDLSYSSQIVGKMDVSGYAIGILLTIIVFFAVYYYGYGVAMSVASEKTSRVMETLVVSAKPSRILLGKCLAMGVLGLVQLLAFLVVGAVCFATIVPAGFTIMGMPLALSSFTFGSALLVLVYFLLGYALYAVMNSVCGATVSRAEDLNSAMMPVVLVSLISFYAAYATMFLPSEGIKRLVTYIPFTSPFVMPFRLLNEQVPVMDILISLALLLVSIVLVAAVSVRIYTASVLHYGQRLKLKDAMKLKT